MFKVVEDLSRAFNQDYGLRLYRIRCSRSFRRLRDKIGVIECLGGCFMKEEKRGSI